MSAAGILYIPYLIALLVLPLVMYWRRGLAAMLVVVLAELAFVLLFVLVLNFMDLLPRPPAPGPMPETGIMEHLNRTHAEALAHFVVLVTMLVIIPWIAALTGGLLSLAWAAALAVRRYYLSRGHANAPPASG